MKRHLLPPLMTTFDLCDTTLPNAQRDVTTVAPQALALLNNTFSHDQSTALAKRIQTLAKSSRERAALAWRLALGRDATVDELTLALDHVEGQAARVTQEAKQRMSSVVAWRVADATIPTRTLVFHVRADKGIVKDESGRVVTWSDQSGADHDASQLNSDQRPIFINKAMGDFPAVRFDGLRQFLDIDGQLLQTPACSVFAVVTDRHSGGHREIISNWKRGENVGSSIFLGLTSRAQVRFSDSFSNAGRILNRDQPFVLAAINSSGTSTVFQNASELGRRDSGLPNRKLGTPWVIGQQGDINGEFWNGDIAELLVYDRALSVSEQRQVWSVLLDRYKLATFVRAENVSKTDAELLALASLCHVVLNSNEFIYVD